MSAAHAAGRLREALSAHLSDDGVRFNSRTWIAGVFGQVSKVAKGKGSR